MSFVSPVFQASKKTRRSPDGKMVAFSWNGEKQDNFDIYVKLVNAGEQLQRLTSDPADEFSPVWSSDSRYVAYMRSVEGRGIIYLCSPLRRR